MNTLRILLLALALGAAALATSAAAAAYPTAGGSAAPTVSAAVALVADPAPSPTATPQLTISADPATVTAGDTVTLTVHLGIPAASVQLSDIPAGETVPTPIATLTTNDTGDAVWSGAPSVTTTYQADYAGDGVDWLPATADVAVPVAPRITFSAAVRAYSGTRVKLRLQVRPAHPGGAVTVQIQKDGVWADLRTVTLGDDSRALMSWRTGSLGQWPLRAVMAADAQHVEGDSAVHTITVIKPNPYNVPINAKSMIVVVVSQYRLHFFSYGVQLRSFPCVTGRPSLPTPIGHFRVYQKVMWPGGPNGARMMKYHYPVAIHGTNQPWLLKRFPRNFSHGCTRLLNKNVIWVYDHTPVGTRVWNLP